jgi:Probable N6-adenine methyltransferase
MSDSDDDFSPPALTPELLAMLSPEARAALQDVLATKALDASGEAPEGKESAAGVSENWNLSQFWYSKVTSDLLAREMLKAVESSGITGPIACLSCPSTYNALRVGRVWLTLYGSIFTAFTCVSSWFRP